MSYLRIARNKFWGWVVVSLIAGLALGVGAMLIFGLLGGDSTRSLNNRIQVVQADLASAEASLSALAGQNAQLTIDLEAANAQIAELQAASQEETPTDTDADTETTTTPKIKVTSRTISPSSVVASENVTLTMTAKVTGSPTKVTMRIYNKSKSYDKTFTLTKSSTSGGTETWKATAKAPTAVGTYSYYATAIKGSERVTMAGVSPATLKVK